MSRGLESDFSLNDLDLNTGEPDLDSRHSDSTTRIAPQYIIYTQYSTIVLYSTMVQHIKYRALYMVWGNTRF